MWRSTSGWPAARHRTEKVIDGRGDWGKNGLKGAPALAFDDSTVHPEVSKGKTKMLAFDTSGRTVPLGKQFRQN
jgi:hypothetical protein